MLLSYLNTNKLPELSEDELADIPSQISANIGVVLAKHWKLDDATVNCIRSRDQFDELTSGPFNLQDVFQLATLIHRIHDQNDQSLPSLDKSTPVKKAALHGLLGDSLDHFVMLVDAQASLLLNTITGQNQNGHQLMSAASRYEIKGARTPKATVTNISAAKRYCA
jgi:HD-like signal output (HDOD) protein